MPRWILWMVIIDSVLIPVGVVLILVGQTIPGVAVLVLDGVLTVLAVVFGKGGIGGLSADAKRNAELSASGVPGKSGPSGQQSETEGRIFED